MFSFSNMHVILFSVILYVFCFPVRSMTETIRLKQQQFEEREAIVFLAWSNTFLRKRELSAEDLVSYCFYYKCLCICNCDFYVFICVGISTSFFFCLFFCFLLFLLLLLGT